MSDEMVLAGTAGNGKTMVVFSGEMLGKVEK